jgi:site-specific DNA recombinase
LVDPTAKGVHRANYTKRVNDKKWAVKPEGDWVLNKVEPIISEELWEQCNQIIDEQRTHRKSTGRVAKHLFTGFAYCQCDTKMYVPSNAPKYICPKCRNKISIPDLEEIFHQQLKGFLFSPDEISKHLEQADTVIKEKQQLLTTLTDEIQKIKKEMDKTYQLYLDEEISKKGFGERYKPMEERLEQIDEQTLKLQAEITYLKVQYASSDEVLNEAKDLYSRWPTLERAEKRQIIENITEKVIIGEKEVTINLCYLPFFPEMMTDKARNVPAPFLSRRYEGQETRPNGPGKASFPQSFFPAHSFQAQRAKI